MRFFTSPVGGHVAFVRIVLSLKEQAALCVVVRVCQYKPLILSASRAPAMTTPGGAELHSLDFHLQVLVQGCQLDKTDLEDFLHHIYHQLRTLENNIAQVLHQHHKQVCASLSSWVTIFLWLFF